MRTKGMLTMLLLFSALSGCNPVGEAGGGVTSSAGGDGAKPAPNDAAAKDGAKPAKGETPAPRAVAVFAGGCFWCVEAVFEELEGVHEAISGYSGGTKETANYRAVCTGETAHAEAVEIIYDPTRITYEKLLAVHFATHDPTTLNRQGHDEGPQYRSAVFYASEQEKEAAVAAIARLNEAGVFKRKIVTTLEPLKAFYPAEKEHQNYVCNNPYNPYVQGVAMPKVDKVREKFKEGLKAQSPLQEK